MYNQMEFNKLLLDRVPEILALLFAPLVGAFKNVNTVKCISRRREHALCNNAIVKLRGLFGYIRKCP